MSIVTQSLARRTERGIPLKAIAHDLGSLGAAPARSAHA